MSGAAAIANPLPGQLPPEEQAKKEAKDGVKQSDKMIAEMGHNATGAGVSKYLKDCVKFLEKHEEQKRAIALDMRLKKKEFKERTGYSIGSLNLLLKARKLDREIAMQLDAELRTLREVFDPTYEQDLLSFDNGEKAAPTPDEEQSPEEAAAASKEAEEKQKDSIKE